MVTTIFENLLLEAYEQNAVTNWYGEIGMSFDNIDTARRYRAALLSVSGISEVSNPDIDGPNKHGIYFIWCTPKTATASAIAHIIVKNFRPVTA